MTKHRDPVHVLAVLSAVTTSPSPSLLSPVSHQCPSPPFVFPSCVHHAEIGLRAVSYTLQGGCALEAPLPHDWTTLLPSANPWTRCSEATTGTMATAPLRLHWNTQQQHFPFCRSRERSEPPPPDPKEPPYRHVCLLPPRRRAQHSEQRPRPEARQLQGRNPLNPNRR